jgi:molybdopterin-guanine dinucleotide biosynthesis protein
MSVKILSDRTIARAKRAFTTRRVPVRDMKTLISGCVKPASGDLVLASIHEIGKHRKIEQPSGRRAQLLPGDEIIVCYGSRYAPDQYEAIISEDLGLCDLVAAGGIASREVNRHDRMLPPTKIMPIGLIGNHAGNRLNVADYRISSGPSAKSITVILVVGTAMNSGKTFTAASIIYSLKPTKYRVAGIKATGTGSGGDIFLFKDMGADVVLDFTDGGFSSTYLQPDEDIERTTSALIDHAAWLGCDIVVLEVADGLRHKETEALLRSNSLRDRVSSVVFAAYDSMGAKAGYDILREWGYRVLAVSGQLTRSPLAMRETANTTDAQILSPFQIQAGALIPAITGENGVNGSNVFREDDLNTILHDGVNFGIYPSSIMSTPEIPEIVNARYFGLHDNNVDFDYTEDFEELSSLSQVLKLG